MNTKFVWAAVLMAAFVAMSGYAGASPDSIEQAQQAIAQDTKDVERFLSFRVKLQSDVSKKEKEKLDFSIAEYYFKIKDYSDAQRAFADYLTANPDGIGALLANVYLFKLAKLYGKEEQAAVYKKELFKNQFVLLFDKFKVINYKSLNHNEYTVHYFLDHIEFYLNGDVFEQISP